MKLEAATLAAPHGLHGVSLTLAAGEHVAVIGPSGAGKTTLLHLLAGAQQPSGGTLKLGDADPWMLGAHARRALRQRLVLAPQVPPLPPRQRVVTAVLAGALARLTRWQALRALVHPAPEQAAEVQAALAPLGLADALWQRVDRLSGGERQRVALARLLVAPATLWLVDEPLAALDPVRAAQTLGVLTDAARARGATLVVSLHQVDAALARFGRIVGLRAGRVQFDLPREQVTSDLLTALYAGEVAESAPATAPAPAVFVAC